MKKLLLFLAVIGGVAWLLTDGEPAEGPHFETSYLVAKSEAKKSGKPLVLVYSASWCPPCQTMRKRVYPSAAVKPFHDKFVWAYLDVDDPANASTAREHGVEGIPHIEFTSPQGEPLIDELVGGEPPESFALRLRSVLAKLQTSAGSAASAAR